MSLPNVSPGLNVLRHFGPFCLIISLIGCSSLVKSASETPTQTFAKSADKLEKGVVPHGLIVHGGAGAGTRASMSAKREASMRSAMTQALNAGYRVLDSGGSSLDAVTAAIVILENEPTFNAGKGAVFNAVGSHELDASIMDGSDLNAGAVAGVSTIKNPILLARAVMEHSPHVMLSGQGAEEFAQQHGLEQVPTQYFDTPRRREQLERALQTMAIGNEIPSVTSPQSQGHPIVGQLTLTQSHGSQLHLSQSHAEQSDPVHSVQLSRQPSNQGEGTTAISTSAQAYFGTVGVVALDKKGNLAAGTSTGGMTAKRFGRIGDSPVIGAGTYANNYSCGVSSTGHGEFFIRHVVAYTICARMQFGELSLSDAADQLIMKELPAVGGTGGVVAMDAKGNIAWPYNTSSMVRGHRSSVSPTRVLIFENE